MPADPAGLAWRDAVAPWTVRAFRPTLSLPDDVVALRTLLLAQDEEVAAQKRARLARVLRVAFGRSSEKLRTRVEQLELTLADIDELL